MDFRYANNFVRLLIRRMKEHDIPGLSAQLSFYFLLALFPFLIFLFTLLAYLPLSSDEVLNMVRLYAPADIMNVIEENVHQVLDVQRGGLLSFSIIATIWSSSNGMHALMRALNRAYDVEENRPFLRGRAVSILLTFSFMLAIIVTLMLQVFGKVIGLFLFSFFGFSDAFITMWESLRWLISLLFLTIVISYVYYFGPNYALRWKDVYIGALIATAGWQLTSFGFSFYIEHIGDFNAMYGSIGGIIMLMFWFFLGGMILIFGGEINATIRQLQSDHTKRFDR